MYNITGTHTFERVSAHAIVIISAWPADHFTLDDEVLTYFVKVVSAL